MLVLVDALADGDELRHSVAVCDIEALTDAHADADSEPDTLVVPLKDPSLETDGPAEADTEELSVADAHAVGVDDRHSVAVGDTDALVDALAEPLSDSDGDVLKAAVKDALALPDVHAVGDDDSAAWQRSSRQSDGYLISPARWPQATRQASKRASPSSIGTTSTGPS
jgi:hypothetical protein